MKKWIYMTVGLLLVFHASVRGGAKMAYRNVDFPDGLTWINTDKPLHMDDLKGHVVLLDFWTYCCINCMHILPDLKYLEKKYADQPFVVIGVHSPKFLNEREETNVRSAVHRYRIEHPVVMDNEHRLWTAYGVRAWPTFVLLDAKGDVISRVSGEGQRDYLDEAIHQVLSDAKKGGMLASEKLSIRLDPIPERELHFPGKIDIDEKGRRLFISNSNNHQILVVQLQDSGRGKLLDTIGNGQPGFTDGDFDKAGFRQPQGVAYAEGKLYIADTENHALRVADLKKRQVKTLAGVGEQGYVRDYSGDPLKVALSSPWDVVVDNGILYIAMAGNHQIWKLDLKKNRIENYAGSGAENIVDGPVGTAALAQPSGLSMAGSRLYFADSEVSGLRYVGLDDNRVRTLVGQGLFVFGHRDGHLDQVLLQHPLGLDVEGNMLYIADTYNHAIRVIDLQAQEIFTLIHRTEHTMCRIDDEDCNVLPLFEPNDVVVFQGKLFIADTNNHLIRVFDLKTRELIDLIIT